MWNKNWEDKASKQILADIRAAAYMIQFPDGPPEPPTSATHTMIVDDNGVVHYNTVPDKIRPPELWG